MNEAFEPFGGAWTMRVMGPHERPRFASDAWGHLMRLSRSGILGAVELEHVIERALIQIDGRISLTELRGLLSESGLDNGGDEPDLPALH